MPFATLKLMPGVNSVETPTLNQSGISSSNLIRFRNGLVEKMGGWINYAGTSIGSITRCLHAWQDLSQNKWLAIGSDSSLKVILNGSAISDITPQILTSNCALNVSTVKGSNIVTIIDTNVNNLTQFDAVFFNTPISVGGLILTGMEPINPTPSGTTYTIFADRFATSTVNNAGAVPSITTAANSTLVTVTFTGHGLVDGDKFVFPIPTIVGGITISGLYEKIVVVDANTFTFTAPSAAISTATASMNAGSAQYRYGIAVGSSGSQRIGAPPGAIGQYAIGEGFSRVITISAQTGTPITASDWTLVNWGEILLACPRGGQIWYWPPGAGFTAPIMLGEGPAFSNGIFIAMPSQILVAWGSTSSIESGNTDAEQDPLIVRWSDQLDFTTWDVTSNTQAGSFHVPTGSEIRGAIQGPLQAYIFTDVDVWAMQYIGAGLVFGFTQVGTGCGLVGQHAVATLYNQVFWMNDSNFFVTGGGSGVQDIPCSVWDTVFQDLDTGNLTKCVAGANSQFNEITFFYPSRSGGTGECDKYAKYNITEKAWDTGNLPRSAWVDRTILGSPIGSNPSNQMIYEHEVGYSDAGAAMDAFFETGYTPYGDAEQFSVIDYFEPDMKWNTVGNSSSSASISLTLTAAPSPNSSRLMTYGPVTLTSTMEYVNPRIRGRQIKLRMETNDATSWWRLGAPRYRYGLDGRR